MSNFSNYTDTQLVNEYAETKAYADEIYARLEDYKAEIMRRHRETGLMNFEGETATVFLKAEPVSVAWLKRQHGYEEKDLPPEVWTEKVSRALDVNGLEQWLGAQGIKLAPTYTTSLRLKPMKVK
jgi:hypothetical protein